MTVQTSAITWQDQSDSRYPLANYSLNFPVDPIQQFNLAGTYHLNNIIPAGVSVDNSQGAGTIQIQTAAFTVLILPFSREDIDLTNVSQQVTFSFQQTPGQPTISPYAVPIVFWMKKPPGAQQNQLAINTAVQSALVSSLLGNMQPIINSAFTEWPQGVGPFTSVAIPTYYAEGWVVSTTANNWFISQAINPFTQAAFGLKVASAISGTNPVKVGTALTSVDSVQFAGQQITLGIDVVNSSFQVGGSFTVQLVSGTGSDQNIFAPFTGATVLAIASIPFSSIVTTTARITLTTPGPIPSNIKQLGLIVQYTPGAATAIDTFTISRAQIDVGTIAQQFRTVPQLMERDRCLSFFERMNGEAATGYIFGHGHAVNAGDGFFLVRWKKKRAVPTLGISTAAGSAFLLSQPGIGVVGNSGALGPASNFSEDSCALQASCAAVLAVGAVTYLVDQSSGGTFFDINARM
jgi:hypothetical protein